MALQPLQPTWDFLLAHLGNFTSSPGFILSAVMLGVYLPGIFFSVIDVYVAKRLTRQQSWAVGWRAMKGYSTVYVVAMAIFIFVPLPLIYGIVDIHPFTFFVAAFLLTAVTMVTHCGYRIPVYDRIFANSPCHDFHHANHRPTNISVVLTVCDRLFGTYQKA